MDSRLLDNQVPPHDDAFRERLSDLWDRMLETDDIEETAAAIDDTEETAAVLPKVSTVEAADPLHPLTGETTPEEDSKSDRRRSERHSYPSVQKLAPCNLSTLPEARVFVNARFHDISRGGVSFFWSEPPDFEYVVISLGDGQNTVSLLARVIRHQTIAGLQNEYLVCCEFTRRVDDN